MRRGAHMCLGQCPVRSVCSLSECCDDGEDYTVLFSSVFAHILLFPLPSLSVLLSFACFKPLKDHPCQKVATFSSASVLPFL